MKPRWNKARSTAAKQGIRRMGTYTKLRDAWIAEHPHASPQERKTAMDAILRRVLPG